MRNGTEFETVVITGAGNGIGRALALKYSETAETIILFGRTPENLENTRTLCQNMSRRSNPRIFAYSVDQSDPQQAFLEYSAFLKSFPAADLVIANAGLARGAPDNTPTEDLCATITQTNVNFLGSAALVEACLPKMLERKKGHIALMSSLAALAPMPYAAGYTASKAALNGYGSALRASLHSKGLNVSLILPGFVETDMEEALTGIKPFKVSAERAAEIICNNLKKGKRFISFPLPMAFLALLGHVAPSSFYDYCVTRWLLRVRNS